MRDPLPPAPAGFPDSPTTFALPGPAGTLEVATAAAEPECARAGTAVICHPNPQQGGTMRNKVVTMLERSLRESGLSTVRFNFRGVGASTGEFDNGDGESGDLVTVAQWVRKSRPDDQLWLAGFSFGSYVALRSARSLGADPRPTLVRMPDTGHFFHRRLMDLRGAVKNAVRGWLPPPR